MSEKYYTQMEAARKGIITEEMRAVARKEYRTEEEIRDLVAKGQVAICANYGPFFAWEYAAISKKTDTRMSGDDRNCSGL